MTITIAICALTGIAVGFRFKIFVVMLAVLAATAVTAAISLAQGKPLWSVAATVIISSIALQVGYLCSSLAISMREVPATEAEVAVSTATANSYRSRGASV